MASLFYLVFILSICNAVFGSYFFHPFLNTSLHIQTPMFINSLGASSPFSISGKLVHILNGKICDKQLPDINAQIVAVTEFEGCSFDDVYMIIREKGAAGLVFVFDAFTVGRGSNLPYINDYKPQIPLLVIAKRHFTMIDELIDNIGTVQFILEPDPSPYDLMHVYVRIIFRILGLWGLFLTFISIYLLYRSSMVQDISKLVSSCLIAEFIGNILAAFYLLIDPIASVGIFNRIVSETLIFIPFFAYFITNMIIGFYWSAVYTMIITEYSLSLEFTKHVKLIVTISVFIVILCIVSIVFRALHTLAYILLVKLSIGSLILSNLVVCFYFFKSGICLLKALSNHNMSSSWTIKASHNIFRWLIISACFMFTECMGWIGMGTSFAYTPYTLATFVGIAYASVLAKSSSHLITFARHINLHYKKVVPKYSKRKFSSPSPISSPRSIRLYPQSIDV